MVRFIIYLVLVAILAISAYSADEVKKIPTEVTVVENIEDFLSQNPGETLIELKGKQRALTRYYTLGRRVSGDRHVAYGRETNRCESPSIIQVTVSYNGAIISYIEVSVVQTSNIGRAFVISGGIDQRSIAFVIEAGNTTEFNYNVDIYGMD